MLKKYVFYLLRWQLSTPILAPIIALAKHSPSVFGTKEDWIGSAVANLVGGLIFFWIDRCIFSSDKSNSSVSLLDLPKRLVHARITGNGQAGAAKETARSSELGQSK